MVSHAASRLACEPLLLLLAPDPNRLFNPRKAGGQADQYEATVVVPIESGRQTLGPLKLHDNFLSRYSGSVGLMPHRSFVWGNEVAAKLLGEHGCPRTWHSASCLLSAVCALREAFKQQCC